MEQEPRQTPGRRPRSPAAIPPPAAAARSTPGAGAARRPRLLLAALAPFLLLLLLTAGIRLAGRLSNSEDGRDELMRRMAGRPSGGRRAIPRMPLPPAPPADAATQSAIEGTIRGQLGAFGRADFRAALGFAVPEIRASLNPDDFGRMVQGGGYAVMCEADSSKVERARVRDGRQAVVRVAVIGHSGAKREFLYELVKSDGRWCVGGVTPVGPAGRPGAAAERREGGNGAPDGPPRRQHQQERPRPVIPMVDIREV